MTRRLARMIRQSLLPSSSVIPCTVPICRLIVFYMSAIGPEIVSQQRHIVERVRQRDQQGRQVRRADRSHQELTVRRLHTVQRCTPGQLR